MIVWVEDQPPFVGSVTGVANTAVGSVTDEPDDPSPAPVEQSPPWLPHGVVVEAPPAAAPLPAAVAATVSAVVPDPAVAEAAGDPLTPAGVVAERSAVVEDALAVVAVVAALEPGVIGVDAVAPPVPVVHWVGPCLSHAGG